MAFRSPSGLVYIEATIGVPILSSLMKMEMPCLMPTNSILSDKISQHGCNIWFSQSVEELLQGFELLIPEICKLSKGQDTLDVWIDSGCSHRAVIHANEDISWPADLYLEGSDQHRGWFQSSLWTSMVSAKAPIPQNLGSWICCKWGRKENLQE